MFTCANAFHHTLIIYCSSSYPDLKILSRLNFIEKRQRWGEGKRGGGGKRENKQGQKKRDTHPQITEHIIPLCS